MKRLTLSKIFGGVLLGTLLLGCGVAMGGCQEPVIDSSSNSGSSVIEEINAEKVNEMLAALPDKNAFESKNIPDLETVINYYNQLSDGEKELVTYTKIEELLALPIYLDDQVKEYIPQSVERVDLTILVTGKIHI